MGVMIMAILFGSLAGCSGKTPEETQSPPWSDDTKTIDYADLYRNPAEKTPPLSGKTVYRASFGYTENTEQGYNCYRYQYAADGAYVDMVCENGVWSGGGATLRGGEMTPGAASAVRTFVAPADGEILLYGNPKLLTGNSVTVRVEYRGESLVEETVTDKTGIFHSDRVPVAAGETVRFVAEGDGTVYWNPTADYTLAPETGLHYAPDGYFGDVHPFYDTKTGTMYMYYLSTGLQENGRIETFTTLLSTSRNMIRYTDTPMFRDEKNPPPLELYYALGVIVDKDGRYRSSYGAGNYVHTVVSDDLIHWENALEPYIDETTGLLKYKWRIDFDTGVYSGRDPDLTYDPASGKYYCVVMNYYSASTDKGEKYLNLYTGGGDGIFSSTAVKLVSFTGRGDPECPQFKKIGDRWYLFYSVYGTGTKGNVGKLAYRAGDAGAAPENVDWESKTEYYLDGGDLHAAQICSVGDKWYAYGWLNYRAEENVWGGYLNLPREVYARADGTLASRMDPCLSELLVKGRMAVAGKDTCTVAGFGEADGRLTLAAGEGKATFRNTFGRTVLSSRIELPETAEYAGFSIGEGNTTYHALVTRTGGKTYLCVTVDPASPLGGVWIEIKPPAGNTFDLTVVADGSFLEVFVNGEYALSAHTKLSMTGEKTIAVAAKGAGVAVTRAEVLKLADYNNIFD